MTPHPLLDEYSTQSIFYVCNMNATIEKLTGLLKENLPGCAVKIDEPDRSGGNYWIDISLGRKRRTLEYRPGKGFGLFHDDAGFGQGPAEIYRSAERAVQRLAQVMASASGKTTPLGLRQLRELYGQSQVKLAKKAG